MSAPSAPHEPTPSELRDLRDKLARIAELRDADERAPGPVLAALAARWPGALRELDDLPREVVASRLAELDARLADGGPAPSWAAAQVAFHALARGALAAKRWLAGRREVDEATRRAFDLAFADDDETRAWAPRLAELARPPRGRVLALVWSVLAERLGRDESAARDLVRGGGLRASRR